MIREWFFDHIRAFNVTLIYLIAVMLLANVCRTIEDFKLIKQGQNSSTWEVGKH